MHAAQKRGSARLDGSRVRDAYVRNTSKFKRETGHEEANMRLKGGVLAVGLALAFAAFLPTRGAHAGEGTDVQAEIVLKVCCERLAALKSYSFSADVDRDFAFPLRRHGAHVPRPSPRACSGRTASVAI